MSDDTYNTGTVNYDISTVEGMKNAVAWQQHMIDMLADGGRWVVPRSMSMSIYILDKPNKRVKRVSGLFPEPVIARVFDAMGWTVIEATEA